MKSDDEYLGKEMVDGFLSKRTDVLIEFKSMSEILNEYGAWFDGHGNLCVPDYNGTKTQLSPAYFHKLGKQIKTLSHHSYPTWAIKREWQDMFAPNMALRAIAHGTADKERMIELANKAVLAK